MKDGQARKRGQIVLLLAFLLLGLLFLVLVNVDVFLAIRGKGRLQNAGDAAALAAARWQGITLNAAGALNLAQLDAACRFADDLASGDAARAGRVRAVLAGLQNLQERLLFAGPLAGLHASQLVARRNGALPDAGMTRLVEEALARAGRDAAAPSETWPDQWRDYADMLRGAVRDGVVAGCDNARYYNYAAQENHPLFDKAFYAAVDGRDWCWFFLRDDMMGLLQSFTGWGDIPSGARAAPTSPEFYPVDVVRRRRALADLDPEGDAGRARRNLLDLAARNGCASVSADALDRSGAFTNGADFVWCLYGDDWRPWTEMHVGGESRLPLRSDVQPRYDVFGASAAARVAARLTPFTPDVPAQDNVWVAAAKPFGEIDGRTVTLDGEFPLVTPAFTAVRLILLAGASEARLGMADDAWVRHTRDHLPAAASGAPAPDCAFCRTLAQWHDAAFRREGLAWLQENSHQCRRPTDGSGPGGGTRHAH